METINSFNSNFYIVAATVIPVYFIALLLPGGGGALYRYWRWVETWRNRKVALAAKAKSADGRSPHLYYALLLPPIIVLACGMIGEINALVSLDRQSAFLCDGVPELIWLVPLPVIAGVGVMIAVIVDTMPKRNKRTPPTIS